MKEYLIFDLDGTLTDPKIGITTCVQYALKEFGIEETDPDKLTPFIGPPLKESFMEFYDMSEEQAKKAVEKYRERFAEVGLFENKVYAGIPDMLRLLKNRGAHLAIASSKPTVYVERILEHFHIKQYFEVIVGSELDGRRVNKDEVLREALRRLFGHQRIEYEKVLMIGDRKFDIEGAKSMNVESVGVAYGYGSVEELKDARADYIVLDVKELQKLLFSECEGENKPRMFLIIWAFLYPLLLFVVVKQVAANALMVCLQMLGNMVSGSLAEWMFVYDENGALIGQTGNTGAIMSALAYSIAVAFIWNMAIPRIKRAKEEMYVTHLRPEKLVAYPVLLVVTIGAALGTNVLFELTGVSRVAQNYQAMMQDAHAASLPVALLCIGIIMPVTEELLFRGIVFNVLKRRYPMLVAIVGSAVIYGAYTMEIVPAVSAFVIGLIAAYAYEYFGSFFIPVLVHVISSVITYLISYTSLAQSGLFEWPVCIISLLLTVAGSILLIKDKRMF